MCKNIRDSFKLYKENSESPVDVKTYINYTSEYNKFLMQKVFEGQTITLPSRMGLLSIVGKKQKISFDENGNVKGLAPDWVKTKKMWEDNPEAKEAKKLLYHVNSHTDNIRYRFLWSKLNIITLNKTLYALRLTREHKREVNDLVVNKGMQYLTKM